MIVGRTCFVPLSQVILMAWVEGRSEHLLWTQAVVPEDADSDYYERVERHMQSQIVREALNNGLLLQRLHWDVLRYWPHPQHWMCAGTG